MQKNVSNILCTGFIFFLFISLKWAAFVYSSLTGYYNNSKKYIWLLCLLYNKYNKKSIFKYRNIKGMNKLNGSLVVFGIAKSGFTFHWIACIILFHYISVLKILSNCHQYLTSRLYYFNIDTWAIISVLSVSWDWFEAVFDLPTLDGFNIKMIVIVYSWYFVTFPAFSL